MRPASYISRLLFLCISAVTLCGCSLIGRSPYPSPWPNSLPTDITQTQAVLLLQQRSPAVSTLQTQTRTVLQRRRLPGKLNLNVTLLYEKPDRLRLIARQPGIEEMVMDLLIKGDAFQLQLPRQSVMSAGNMSELRQSDSPLGRLRPFLVVDALTAENMLARELSDPGGSATWRSCKKRYVVKWETEQRRFEYRLRKTDLLPERLVIRDPRGKKLARIDYQGFKLDQEVPVAEELLIRDYLCDTKLHVNVRSMKRNPKLRDAVFQMRPNVRLQYVPSQDLQLE